MNYVDNIEQDIADIYSDWDTAVYSPQLGGNYEIRGILMTPYVDFGDHSTDVPVFMCSRTSVPGVSIGDGIAMNAESFTIREIKPDRRGDLILTLERAL